MKESARKQHQPQDPGSKNEPGAPSVLFGFASEQRPASLIEGSLMDPEFRHPGHPPTAAKVFDVAGWAYFDYELANAISECSEVLQ